MLLKVGRPLAEIETTVHQASQREADRLHGNIRWLNLASALAPLLGLLGTMQGMILAFHLTTVLPAGANKSVELAGGIYTALVTTFAGLCVAIPATAFAHYFEGRIMIMFHQIDELVFSLLPQLERYEGRVRFNRQETDEAPAEEKETPVAAK
jgi:biopolymer transport protein ExbB